MHPVGLAVRLELVAVFLSALAVVALLPRRRRPMAWAIVIIGFVAPFFSFSPEADWRRVAWVPFAQGPLKPLDLLSNAVLYLPFGVFFEGGTEGHSSLVWCAVCAAALSGATEVAQVFGHGRFPSATDNVMNVVGALVGFLLAARSRPEGAIFR